MQKETKQRPWRRLLAKISFFVKTISIMLMQSMSETKSDGFQFSQQKHFIVKLTCHIMSKWQKQYRQDLNIGQAWYSNGQDI